MGSHCAVAAFLNSGIGAGAAALDGSFTGGVRRGSAVGGAFPAARELYSEPQLCHGLSRQEKPNCRPAIGHHYSGVIRGYLPSADRAHASREPDPHTQRQVRRLYPA